MTADTFFNGSRPAQIMPEMATGIWLLGFTLAFSGPLLSFFGKHSFVVVGIAVIISCVSFSISIISGISAIELKSENIGADYDRKVWIEKKLSTDLTPEAIHECWKAPAGLCVAADRVAQKRELEEELSTLSRVTKKDVSVSTSRTQKALMVGMAILPLASLAGSIILSMHVRLPRPIDEIPEETELLGAGYDSERLVRESVGVENTPEIKKKEPKTRKRSYVPTDEQHEQLKYAYRSMRMRGEKITNKTLAKKAKMNDSVAGWWRKNTDLETIAGTELVPHGKPTLVSS